MPGTCMGHYRNVALCEVLCDDDGVPVTPKMISDRARGMVRVVQHYGPQNVGTTSRCAYQRTLVEAEAEAAQRNTER